MPVPISISYGKPRDPNNYESIADTSLETPVIVRVINKAAFVTWTYHGHQKRIMTNRRGLEYIRDILNRVLDNPLSNTNGETDGKYSA